jgi:tRNA modification GTPase
MDKLLALVGNIVRQRLQIDSPTVLTRERHRHAATRAAEALERSGSAAAPELAAEEIRLAMRELGRITGRVDIEDLLDVVFRDFCIGK